MLLLRPGRVLRARVRAPMNVRTDPRRTPGGRRKNEEERRRLTCPEAQGVHDIGGDEAHGDAHIEGNGAEKVNVCVDVLLEVVGADVGHGGVADPEGVVGEVEHGDGEQDQPAAPVLLVSLLAAISRLPHSRLGLHQSSISQQAKFSACPTAYSMSTYGCTPCPPACRSLIQR